MDTDAPVFAPFEEDLTLLEDGADVSEIIKESCHGRDSEYDTDIEIPEPVPTPYDQWGKRTYRRVCRKLKVTPMPSVLRDLETEKIDVGLRGINEYQILAITSSLLDNASVKSLNLEGNALSLKACRYLYLGLKENLNIETLNLRNCSLNHSTTPIIAHLLVRNDNFKTVNLAENNLDDDDIKYIEGIIQESKSIEELDFSHNSFAQESSFHFGHTLANNDVLRKLDLSWNLFNGRDAMHLCKGLQENVKLSTLDLSMNGIANAGVKHVVEMLKVNVTLTDLDLSCNRISDKGAYLLGRALEKNENLKILKLSKNPITYVGVMGVINGIKKNEASVMSQLNIVSVHVFQSAIELLTEVKEIHPHFKLICGQVVDDVAPIETPRVQEQSSDDDPLHILKYHLISKRRRLINHFKRERVGGDGVITRQQFKEGIKAMKIPLTTAHINSLAQAADTDGTGEVNFIKLVIPSGAAIELPVEDGNSSEDGKPVPGGPTRQTFITEK